MTVILDNKIFSYVIICSHSCGQKLLYTQQSK
jgi:hypothetical protein